MPPTATRPAPGSAAQAPAPTPRRTAFAAVAGAAGMIMVGVSVAVSGTLVDAPVLTTQALRYAVACLLLVGFARLSRRSIRWPRGTEWWWLLAVAGSGLVVFNLALVYGAQHAEPAALGVGVACVPLVLSLAGPVLDGSSLSARVVVGAAAVTLGAALVQGFGRTDAVGLLWAGVVFVCEAGFTLFAVPVLGPLGAYGVSVHATWIAAVAFAVLGVGVEGVGAIFRLDLGDLAAAGYLAVGVTAVAFVLWYGCVERLGAARTGLLTGIAPISAAVAGVALGGPVPGVAVWIGITVVAGGLILGLSTRRRSKHTV